MLEQGMKVSDGFYIVMIVIIVVVVISDEL
jgi:hypothetical protein